MSDNTYILSWDCYGLEGIVPLSDIEAEIAEAEKQHAWEVLSTPNGYSHPIKNPARYRLHSIVNGMIMRARFNPQRNYEIYLITTIEDITADTLKQQFEGNPQGMAELIREKGTKLYSDRATTKRVIE